MKSIKTLCLSLLILGFLALPSCAPKKAGPGLANPVGGSVVFLEGQVSIDGKPAQIGQVLGARATIETGPASTCDLVFDGKNALRVSQNSLAILDLAKLVKEIDLKKGGVTAILKKLERLADKDSFRVTAPTAIAGVRGTSFCVWADATTSYVCACNGTVRTVDSAGSNEEVLAAAHHTARLYTRAGGSITKVPAGIAHHDDASVEKVASRIDYTVDWTKIDD